MFDSFYIQFFSLLLEILDLNNFKRNPKRTSVFAALISCLLLKLSKCIFDRLTLDADPQRHLHQGCEVLGTFPQNAKLTVRTLYGNINEK